MHSRGVSSGDSRLKYLNVTRLGHVECKLVGLVDIWLLMDWFMHFCLRHSICRAHGTSNSDKRYVSARQTPSHHYLIIV